MSRRCSAPRAERHTGSGHPRPAETMSGPALRAVGPDIVVSSGGGGGSMFAPRRASRCQKGLRPTSPLVRRPSEHWVGVEGFEPSSLSRRNYSPQKAIRRPARECLLNQEFRATSARSSAAVAPTGPCRTGVAHSRTAADERDRGRWLPERGCPRVRGREEYDPRSRVLVTGPRSGGAAPNSA